MFPPASIHGRFQVLHLEHLEYFRRAADRYGCLYVGLTGQLRDQLGEDPRTSSLANPLTYWERVEMWRRVLDAEGVDLKAHRIGPFPIESPEALPDFVPYHSVCTTTVREPWNLEKVRRLENLGYTVDILLHNPDKALSATTLRSMIARDDEGWEAFVPASVADFLRS